VTSDRELLERAALAAGYPWRGWSGNVALLEEDVSKPEPRLRCPKEWNPLTDDGDALRLAVKLHMGVQSNGPDHFQSPNCTIVLYETVCPYRLSQPHEGDPNAATRKAIVRAAAAMAPEEAE
jgi:hypothetical protein